MPVHDWTKVDDGVFHHFHTGWLVRISDALNDGLLPDDYYALAEQSAGIIGPDVLTLQPITPPKPIGTSNGSGGTAVALAPPQFKHVFRCERNFYLHKQRHVAIRHRSGDRLIAIVEIVSHGNKSSSAALRQFVEKAAAVLQEGIHLLVVDVYPPTHRDPQGIHGAIWNECTDDSYKLPKKKRLTATSYEVSDVITAYAESFAVGDPLPEMPLFFAAAAYVNVPLERTYQATWEKLPKRIRSFVTG